MALHQPASECRLRDALGPGRRRCNPRRPPSVCSSGPADQLFLGRAFRAFNTGFDVSTNALHRCLSPGWSASARSCSSSTAGLLVLTWWGFTHTPTGFIPQQDKGYLLVNVQLPDAASVTRTRDVVERIEKIALETPGVKHTVAIAGQSILLNANASNFGALYLMLDDFENRTAADFPAKPSPKRCKKVPKGSAAGDRQYLRPRRSKDWARPAASRSSFRTRATTRLATLQKAADNVVAAGEAGPHLEGLFTSFRADTPWLELIIDRTQAKDRGVSIDDIRTTLESTIGPYYINDFNRFGRTWQVNVQARDVFRQSVDDIKQLRSATTWARGAAGRLRIVRFVSGPVMVTRYNMYAAAAIHADAGPDTSSGQAIAALEKSPTTDLPQIDADRVDRVGPSPTSNRQHRDVGVRAGGRAGVPGAGGPVRKLVAAAGRHPGGADVPAVRHRRRGRWRTWTSTSSRRSASSFWSAWRARTRS